MELKLLNLLVILFLASSTLALMGSSLGGSSMDSFDNGDFPTAFEEGVLNSELEISDDSIEQMPYSKCL